MKIPYRTATKLIDIGNLTVEDIDIEDIAISLAGQSRYNGSTRPVYTVAHHSVLCSRMAPPEHKLSALLHDAHEYILGDIARPSAQFIMMHTLKNDNGIQLAKDEIDAVIEEKFGVSLFCNKIVREIDNRIIATEMVRFYGVKYSSFEPYEVDDLFPPLLPIWNTHESYTNFMAEFKKNTGE